MKERVKVKCLLYTFVRLSVSLLQEHEKFGVYHSEQRVCKWKGSRGSTKRLKGPYPPLG